MPTRRLSAEEAALWRRVMAQVRPIVRHPAPASTPASVLHRTAPLIVNPPQAAKRLAKAMAPIPTAPPAAPKQAPAKPPAPGTTLDGGWDRRLSRGLVSPDSSIDLHGHNLTSAYSMLDQGLGHAIARGDRLLLLVTGKPPRAESERPHARGAIRAAVGDWLAGSRHADRIAAVRGAHPRHGGTGALYIIIRRPRQVF